MKLSFVTGVLVSVLTTPLFVEAQSWGDSDRETFRWRGRVDGVDDIVVRGNEVKIEHVSAMPIQKQDHRFSAPLPSAEIELTLTQMSGRGTVRLLEQPTKRNQYTAVIRVDDQDHSGDSDYEFEISWAREDSRNRDVYDSVFRWRGRVDIACEIEIQGGRYTVTDEGGTATREKDASFTEPLPGNEVPVSLNKRKGRGRVEIVQTPSSRNGFTAVVRIKDDKGGADDYDFELRWPRR